MDNTPTTLQKAYQLIKAGDKQQAVDLLTPIAYAEPDNSQVWYLLGFAHTDPVQRIHAFEQVLRLDPGNQPAQKQLAKLRSAAVVAPVTPASIEENAREATAEMSVALRWVLGIGGVLLLCLLVLAVGLWWTLQGSRPAPVAQPVSATASATPISLQTANPLESATFGPRLSSTPRASVTPYPRRATLTPLSIAAPTQVPLIALLTAAALNLTSAVPAPTVVATPNMDIFTNSKINWKPAAVTDIKRGHLKAGESASLSFNLDSPAQVTFILGATAKTPPVFTLTDPKGLLIDEAYIKTHLQETAYINGPFGLPAIQVNYPVVGEWKVNLTAVDESDYQANASYNGASLKLGIASDKSQYLVGDFVTIAARLEDNGAGLAGATVTAIIALPDSTAKKITLKDLGHGYYAKVYQMPDVSGLVTIDMLAEGSNQGILFVRSASMQATAVSSDIKLTGQYADRLESINGQQTLNIEVGIDSGYAGDYKFTGQLMFEDKVISVAVVNVTLVQGHNRITLRFRGHDIFASKLNGPYKLAWISFSRTGTAPSPQMKTDWQTAAYHWQDFTP